MPLGQSSQSRDLSLGIIRGISLMAARFQDAFVARQPIFDSAGVVHGYELLFREGPLTAAGERELDEGTLRTLDTAFLVHGISGMTGGVPAFLSFSTATLVDDFALLFPAESIAIQIGPYVRFGDSVVDACSRLNRRGYKLVLSDYCQFSWVPTRLMHLIDVVKVDCSAVTDVQLEGVSAAFRDHRATLAAENLDTQIAWRHAQDLGFTLFQGRFLGQPEVISSPEISVGKLEKLRLLQELNREEIDPDTVEQIIKHDPTLSYKLLMFVNSAAVGVRVPVRSIRQAVMMFGRLGMLRWASVIALREVSAGRPTELVREALFRGRFCELVAEMKQDVFDSGEMFLLGLFAQVDLLLARPLQEVVTALPISLVLKAAVSGEACDERRVLDLCYAYERGGWDLVDALAHELGLDQSALPAIYQESVRWSGSLTV
jgi:EAL and modified HD-GYP domain-containing signal transduction protein